MILTGWRRCEVLGLRWSETDLARRTARLTDTKTGASLRALSEAVCAVIDVWLRIAKLGDRPSNITPHVLLQQFR
jgi:integrase